MKQRQEATNLLRKLNRIYGRHIRIKHNEKAQFGASAMIKKELIELNSPMSLARGVLLHEYAHFLPPISQIHLRDARVLPLEMLLKKMHPPKYFANYKKVCKSIGTTPTLTSIAKCKEYTSRLINLRGATK